MSNQKSLLDKLVTLYNEMEGIKGDIKAVKEEAEVDLEEIDIALVDKVAKTYISDKFGEQKEKWDLFEDTYETLIK